MQPHFNIAINNFYNATIAITRELLISHVCGLDVSLSMSKRTRDDTNHKEICLFYFTLDKKINPENDKRYLCKCGAIREKKPNTGWSNLMSHITKEHPAYLQETNQSGNQPSLKMTFYSAKTINIYGWINWILSCGLPFTTVSNQTFHQYTKLTPICYNTFMKYLESLTKLLEKKISKMLPEKFALVFDGWSQSGTSTHFVAVMAKWLSNGNACKALLAFSPLLEETNQNAESHCDFLNFVLQDVFHKDFSNVVCLIGDNCSTNLALADLCEKPFIGCAAHRFNLAVQLFLKTHDPLLTKVLFFPFFFQPFFFSHSSAE